MSEFSVLLGPTMFIGMLFVATLFVKNLVCHVYDEQINELDPDYVKAMNTLNGVSDNEIDRLIAKYDELENANARKGDTRKKIDAMRKRVGEEWQCFRYDQIGRSNEVYYFEKPNQLMRVSVDSMTGEISKSFKTYPETF